MRNDEISFWEKFEKIIFKCVKELQEEGKLPATGKAKYGGGS